VLKERLREEMNLHSLLCALPRPQDAPSGLCFYAAWLLPVVDFLARNTFFECSDKYVFDLDSDLTLPDLRGEYSQKAEALSS
jgi:hypothetical protein